MRINYSSGLSLNDTKSTIQMLYLCGEQEELTARFLTAYDIIMLHGFQPNVPAYLRAQCQRLLQMWFDWRGINNILIPYEN